MLYIYINKFIYYFDFREVDIGIEGEFGNELEEEGEEEEEAAAAELDKIVTDGDLGFF